jgi:hypothetical protein
VPIFSMLMRIKAEPSVPSAATTIRRLRDRRGMAAAAIVPTVSTAAARQRIPLLAGDFACLAADAQRGVGEETFGRHSICSLPSFPPP